MTPVKVVILLALCISSLIIVSCNGNEAQSGAAQSVESYLQAMVDRDLNRVVGASCAEWEAQARVEYNSFEAVELTVENLACMQDGQADPFTLVSCTGSIIANYGAEQLKIDVADRAFQAIDEGGEWRMCGYHE
jgi:hypothetical protein